MGSSISIALATYNGAKYLQEQLDSYVAQTLLPDELVVSDDGSTDKTLQIVEEFAKSAPFKVIILPPGPRLGFADNFMRAISRCTGEFIALSDQDDVWLPDKLCQLMNSMSCEVVLSIHRSYLVDSKLKIIGSLNQGIYRNRLFLPLEIIPYYNGLGFGHTFFFRKWIFDLVDFNKRPMHPLGGGGKITHDSWIHIIASAIGSVAHLKYSLCYYRQHENNVFGLKGQTFWQKVNAYRKAPIERYVALEKLYRDVSSLIADINENEEKLSISQISSSALFYEKLSDQFRKRILLYEESNLLKRTLVFLSILKNALSRPLRGRYKISSILKDFFIGLVFFA
jgi:glycosyltransferase involved in cell wall biosynthesis